MYPRTFIHHLDSDRGDGGRERRQTSTYLPYRITPYYVMENITDNFTLFTNQSGGFQKAVDYFESVLSVIRAPRNLTIPQSCENTTNDKCVSLGVQMCGPHARVPDEHLGNLTICDPTCREVGGNSTGVDTDFIFYVTAVDDGKCIIIITNITV